ncbi:MAG: filamentous hemagglutinin N-terminal domain-containing protein, partial [Gemmatimonadaceae bacterium]|nr:filamentous hemagglutinin N-terminal domain-containing protein [Gemmatimonadaceae bacterium]
MTQNMNRRIPGRDSNMAAPHAAGLLAGLSGRAMSSPLGAYHVAPVARRRGSIAAGVGAAAALTASAIAAPEGAQIVIGNVTFTQQGNNWLITASNGAIIDYVSFDILPFETVRFLQPDTMSTVLNRINSAAPTRIDGTLLANGQVYFINPAGVTFGAGSFVDCAAIYAAAANLSNEDFLAGRNNFTGATGSVINEGTLHGSTIAMIGRHVANYGSISTPVGGTVVMAAGSDVLVGEQGGHIFARVSGDGSGMNGNSGLAGVENHGTISAPSGRALMAAGDMFGMAIFNTGTVRAREVNIDGGQHGVVQISGKIDASSTAAGTTGGSIRIVGEKVGLVGANIDARGAAGGGSVTIGRDLTSASDTFGAVFIGNDTTINADATMNGNGGDVRIFGRDVSRVGGNISARGVGTGSGGSVVMAGSQMILAANVNTSGGSGGSGRWTIDVRPIQSSLYGPRVSDITITTGADDADIGVAPNFDVTSNANTVNIQNTSIVNQLNLNPVVTIQNVNSPGVGPYGGRISLLADLSGITGTGTLDIQSVGEIDIQGNIGAGAGALNLILTAGSGITVGNGFTLNLGAGTFNSTNTTGNFTLGLGSSITGTGGGASAITATAGNINLNGDINLGGAFTATANAGFASLNGDLRSAGLFTVSAQSIILSGGIIGNGVTLTATDDIGIDVSPGLSLDAGAGALQVLAGSDGSGTLAIGSAGLGDMTLSGATVLLSAGTLIDINSVALNTVGDTTLRSSDFSITSSLAGNGANTLTFRGFGGGAKTFQLSAAGGTGDIDILTGDLANVAGFTSQTFGQAGDTINLAANLTLARATIFAGGTNLLANVTLSGNANDITFAQTVDGAFDLVVNTTGVTTFGGVVGGGAALNSLSTNPGGSTILTGNVTTVGAQDYNDDVVLAANVIATSTGNADITFAGTVNGDLAANNRTLTINTTGVTTFTGNVGATQTLLSLATNAGGSTVVGGTVSTSGLLSFGDALSFTGVGVKTLTAGDFTFGSTVTGTAGQSLSLQSAGGGIIRISAAGGTGDTDILSAAFNNINGFDLITIGAGAGTVRLAGIVVFQDSVDFAGNVVLFANSIVSSSAGDQVKFSGTVNADAVGNNRTLSINTVGATIFGSTVGATEALASLTTNAGGTTTLFGDVTTTGAQTYNDAVELAGNVIASSTTNQNITFANTVNAASTATDPTLTINTTGTTIFGGVIGGTKALGALTTNAGGTTTL